MSRGTMWGPVGGGSQERAQKWVLVKRCWNSCPVTKLLKHERLFPKLTNNKYFYYKRKYLFSKYQHYKRISSCLLWLPG